MKPLRDRRQSLVAVAGTAVIAAAVLLSVNLKNLPFTGQAASYHADFANAAGLAPGADVRVEGLSVGKVRAVAVQGNHVRVDFSAGSGVALGDLTSASVQVATVLGGVYLQLDSTGAGHLPAGATIPLAHTTVPYTLLDAFGQAGRLIRQTNLPQLRASLNSLAGAFGSIPRGDVSASLSGLASLASTVAAKQNELSQILTATEQVSDTLNSNSAALVSLLSNGDYFLQLLEQRHQIIAQLLSDTSSLGAQLSRLITRNSAQFGPMLAHLNTIGSVLSSEQAQLQKGINLLGQFSTNIANVTGAGPWIDLFSPTLITPDNVIRACGVHPNTTTGPCG